MMMGCRPTYIGVVLRRIFICLWVWLICFGALEVGAIQVQPSGTLAASTKTHWLTASSKKRHNKHCRYFKKSKGRMCAPNEGKPCKICGG
jgi:hypothetical protein